jgi:hypothetical protein
MLKKLNEIFAKNQNIFNLEFIVQNTVKTYTYEILGITSDVE